MSLFPLAAVVIVVLDGRRIFSYNEAFLSDGHVYAPVRPFVTRLADRISYDGGRLIIVRAGRSVSLRIAPRQPDALDRIYVPLAYVMRALGADVSYRAGTVRVRLTSGMPVATPTPYGGQVAVPRPVFTPQPIETPRPVWTGIPLPRRTPLPYPTPR